MSTHDLPYKLGHKHHWGISTTHLFLWWGVDYFTPLKWFNPLFWMVAQNILYEIVHVPTYLGQSGHTIYMNSYMSWGNHFYRQNGYHGSLSFLSGTFTLSQWYCDNLALPALSWKILLQSLLKSKPPLLYQPPLAKPLTLYHLLMSKPPPLWLLLLQLTPPSCDGGFGGGSGGFGGGGGATDAATANTAAAAGVQKCRCCSSCHHCLFCPSTALGASGQEGHHGAIEEATVPDSSGAVKSTAAVVLAAATVSAATVWSPSRRCCTSRRWQSHWHCTICWCPSRPRCTSRRCRSH